MDIWFKALGYIGQIIAIMSRVEAAEQAGQGTVDLPTFYIHTHKHTWTIPTGPAVRTTEPTKPAHPTLPGT